ncbi:profilin [Nocardia sp. alder85J]|uniref:profilin n=1 Tax=Nocardia sp. alder85J TaxID=2862949 RepID=UPI001CD404C6|nr:profilin [Nocardia sp. alder85J]MCX4090965.1 profilin [Nocardia sp. alder85J]
MGGMNVGSYAVRLAEVMRHFRTGDERSLAALVDVLGPEVDALGEGWAREEYGRSPRDVLRHMVRGVNDDGLDIRDDCADDFLYIACFELVVRHYGEPLDGWDSIRSSWFGRADGVLDEAGVDFSISNLVRTGIDGVPVLSDHASAGCLRYDEIPAAHTVLARLRRGDLPLHTMYYVADVRDWLRQCLAGGRDLVCIAGGRPTSSRSRDRRRLFPEERPAGTWQQYVDQQLVAVGPFCHAAIYGLDGRKWAASPGFEVSAAELSALAAPLADPRLPTAGGVRIAGRDYSASSPVQGRLTGSDRTCLLTVQQTSKAVVILLEARYRPFKESSELEEQLIDFIETFG